MITINIEYRLQNEDKWYSKKLSSEEYFDMDMLDCDEILDVDSIPLHFQSNADYVDIPDNMIQSIITTIYDEEKKETKIITEFRYNRFFIRERIIDMNSEKEYELIVDIQISKDTSDVIRFVRNNMGILEMLFHSRIKELPDGSEQEEKIFWNDNKNYLHEYVEEDNTIIEIQIENLENELERFQLIQNKSGIGFETIRENI